jgi:TPP-dependent pyruvate/acetoin dehydrogenase alpha subunit
VQEAVDFAERSPFPSPDSLYEHLYATPTSASTRMEQNAKHG